MKPAQVFLVAVLWAAVAVILVCVLCGCVSVPKLGEKPLADVQVDAAVWKLRVADAIKTEIGPQIDEMRQEIQEVKGIAAKTAQDVQQVGDVKPSAGKNALTVVEHGGAWAVVIVVLGALYLFQWGKTRRYRTQRDGLAERLVSNGGKVRRGSG